MYNIVVLGIVSFLTDISTEMVYPLIPLFLARLGAAPAVMGVIEGIAESLASLLKVASGAAVDKYNRKKPVAVFGYAASSFSKLLLIIAGSWPAVLAARVLDRFGKGVRTAPRDVLIAEGAKKGQYGRAFGLHKMMDMLGSAVGIFASWLIVCQIGLANVQNYQSIFWISLIPAVAGVFVLLLVREKQKKLEPQKLNFRWKALDGKLKSFLIVIFLFTLGNSSNAFLLLRAQERGLSESDVILAYFVFNLIASIFAYPIGRLSDKIGRRKALVAGYALFGAVYIGFALVQGPAGLFALFAAYGLYTALTAGVERAFIAEIAPPCLKGTMLGLHATLVGIGLLPASIVAGLLFGANPALPFWVGGIAGIGAAAAFAVLLRKREKPVNA